MAPAPSRPARQPAPSTAPPAPAVAPPPPPMQRPRGAWLGGGAGQDWGKHAGGQGLHALGMLAGRDEERESRVREPDTSDPAQSARPKAW